MKTSKFSRRSLIKDVPLYGLAMNGTLEILFSSILGGLATKAMGQTVGGRNYLFVQQPGGVPRWMFDLFLTPYSQAGFVPNFCVGTAYVANNGRYTSTEYRTIVKNGINVPPIWASTVPAAGGGNRPMADLLTNLLSMRGIDSLTQSHQSGKQRHFNPLGASESLTALPLRYSNAPFPALNLDAPEYVFRTNSMDTAVLLPSTGNMLSGLLSPFIDSSPLTFRQKRDALNTSLQQTNLLIEQYAAARNPEAVSVSQTQKDAKELLTRSFGNLNTIWADLLAKYKDLILRSLDPTVVIPGLTDLPIGTTGTRDGTYGSDSGIVANADLRTIFTSTSTIKRLAEHFATAEFVFRNNLSGSVVIAPREPMGLAINGGNESWGPDEHNSGKMPSLFINCQMARAYTACLLEMIDQLKAMGQFQNTLISYASEFNRSPRAAGDGSDHLGEGVSVSLFSGVIQGPLVIGNVAHGVSSGAVPGSVGVGAPVAELGNVTLGMGHLGATVAHLLKTPSPLTAFSSVVTEQNGTVVSKIGLAKQV